MVNFFKKLKLLYTPKERHIYAVLHGVYKGEWFVQVDKNALETTFFSLPDKHVRVVPNKEFEIGLNKNIIEPVDCLPVGVYNVCVAEYHTARTATIKTQDEQNNFNNRRKQHTPSQSLVGDEPETTFD